MNKIIKLHTKQMEIAISRLSMAYDNNDKVAIERNKMDVLVTSTILDQWQALQNKKD